MTTMRVRRLACRGCRPNHRSSMAPSLESSICRDCDGNPGQRTLTLIEHANRNRPFDGAAGLCPTRRADRAIGSPGR